MRLLRLLLAGSAIAGTLMVGELPAGVGAALVALALLVGLPHGALDYASAATDYPELRTRRGWLLFHSAYVSLAIAFAMILIAAPALGFLVFCAMSAWHFGQSDCEELGPDEPFRALIWTTRGLVIVGVPILAHPERALPFIETLLGRGDPMVGWIGQSSPLTPLFICLAHLMLMLRTCRRAGGSVGARFLKLIDALVLVAMLWVLDPLLGFALYFVVWHSTDHARRSRAQLGGDLWGLAKTASVYTLAALIGALLLAALAAGAGLARDPTLGLRALAVLVAAVTLPHMVVVEVAIRRRDRVTSPTQAGVTIAGQTFDT